MVMKLFSLKSKVAVITGGAGILGSEIGLALGRVGAKLAICDIISTDEIIKRLKKEGIKAEGYSIDVMNLNEIKECSKKITKNFKKIDILVNCAGGNLKEATTSKEVSFFDLPLKALEKVVELNLFGGAILPCQVFGKIIARNRNGGSIINIASMNAFRPLTRIPG